MSLRRLLPAVLNNASRTALYALNSDRVGSSSFSFDRSSMARTKLTMACLSRECSSPMSFQARISPCVDQTIFIRSIIVRLLIDAGVSYAIGLFRLVRIRYTEVAKPPTIKAEIATSRRSSAQAPRLATNAAPATQDALKIRSSCFSCVECKNPLSRNSVC